MSWLKRSLESSNLALLAGLLMFLATTPPVLMFVWAKSGHKLTEIELAALPPIVGLLSLIVATIVFPSLTADNRLGARAIVALPVLYFALVFLTAKVFSWLLPPLILVGQIPRMDQVWTSPFVLVPSWFLGTFVLVVASAVSKLAPKETP